MGNECGKCCSQTDGDSEYNPDKIANAGQLGGDSAKGKSAVSAGARTSGNFTKGALSGKGLHPEVSRSGQHFDFRNTNGSLERLNIE